MREKISVVRFEGDADELAESVVRYESSGWPR